MYGNDMMTQTKQPARQVVILLIAIPKQHYLFLVKPPIWIFRTQNTTQVNSTPHSHVPKKRVQNKPSLICLVSSPQRRNITPLSNLLSFSLDFSNSRTANQNPCFLRCSLYIIFTFVDSLFIHSF